MQTTANHDATTPLRTGVETVTSISVVVPIHNEIENIPALHQELTKALQALDLPFEIILVDDGSIDGSTQAIEALARRDERLRAVILRRNYGQTAAMQAGVDHAVNDVIVTIDGDLQNDPADIGAMIEVLDQGYDVVHGWRRDRKDALFSRKIPSRVANWLISRVTRFPIHDLGCTLKAIRRRFLDEVPLYGDMHRFIPILLYQRGARCAEVVTHHRARVAGKTKYGIGRTVTVVLDLITVKYLLDYSAHPMRLFGGLAILSFTASVLALAVTILMKLIGGVDMTGNPFFMLQALTGLTGLQFISLGIIGEVLARIYYGDGHRTHYAVRRIVTRDQSIEVVAK